MDDARRVPLILRLLAALLLLSSTTAGVAEEEADKPAAPAKKTLSSPVSYTLQVSLDASTWRLEGEERVTVKNTTGNPIDRLLFRLGPNATAHPVPSKEALRFLGYMDVHAVRIAGDQALPEPPRIEETTMTVRLPEPLAPGGTVKLDIPFGVKLPHAPPWSWGVCGANVTAIDWYPVVCTEGAQGGGGGPRPGFGDYEVTLTLDARFFVEATGRLVECHDEGGRRIARFRAERVRGFAWTADPLFHTVKNVYRGVEIVLLGQPFSEPAEAGLMDRAKAVIDRFRTGLSPYPYPRLVIAVAPYGARRSAHGPMLLRLPLGHPLHVDCLRRADTLERELCREAARQYFLTLFVPRDAKAQALHRGLAAWLGLEMEGESAPGRKRREGTLRILERKLLVGGLNEGFGLYTGDEREAPGDGGGLCAPLLRPLERKLNLTSLVGYESSPFLGQGKGSLFGYRLDLADLSGGTPFHWEALRSRFLGVKHETTVRRDEGKERKHEARAVLAILTLERRIGRETMNHVLRAYVERFRFARPGVSDFLEVVKEKAGAEAVHLAALLLQEGAEVDFAVESVQCARFLPERGVRLQSVPGGEIVEASPAPDLETGARTYPLRAFIRWGEVSPTEGAPRKAGQAGPGEWQWSVQVRNRTGIALPVTVRLHFEGGSTESRSWDGRGRETVLSGTAPHRLLWAEVDPEGIYALDRDLLNNRRGASREPLGTAFLCTWIQHWVQNYLNGWAFFD